MIRHSLNRKVQSGAALVVGLLLLLVLTVLAVSGMSTASLELVMAGNTQYHQNAFQAAETGIEWALINAKFNPGAGVEGPTTKKIGSSDIDQFTATITPQLSGAAQPALWGASWDSFSTYHFEVASTGASARNALAASMQGIAIIAPADSTVAPLGTSKTLE